MTRQQVLPYLKKMDLVVGEVDGDVVVEETLHGYHTSHNIASFRRNTRSHFWALALDLTPARKGPSYQKGVRPLTEASWSNLHHGRLPANFGQSEATFLFTL